MDVFSVNPQGFQGKLINGFDTFVWTERYLKNGDFKLTAPFDPALREAVPIGSYISHFGTDEIAEVMDHEIIKKKGKTPQLVITGDTLETFMKQRLAVLQFGVLRDYFTDEPITYSLPAGNSWDQAVTLIMKHLTGPAVQDHEGDHVPWFKVTNEVTGTEVLQLERVIERGTLYQRVLELLSVAGCGLKTHRPKGTRPYIEFVVHKGRDVSNTVILNANLGELDEATYFWSNRNYKTTAITHTTYNGTNTPFSIPAYNPKRTARRYVLVDATDIDDSIALPILDRQMRAREQQALSYGKMVELTNLRLADDNQFKYNKDYFIGDIVGVAADFGVRTKLRVDEFTWAFDKNGAFGYPTLTLPTAQG